MSEIPLSTVILTLCEMAGLDPDHASIKHLDDEVLVVGFRPAKEMTPEDMRRAGEEYVAMMRGLLRGP